MTALLRLAASVRAFFREMTGDILMIYSEKGMAPFKKPLFMSLPALLVLYNFVYSPLGARLAEKRAALARVRLIAEHYDDYELARLQLAGYQRRLPLSKDKDEWLNYVVTSTAKMHGVVIDSLSSQTEVMVGNFIQVSRTVTVVKTPYAKLGKWLAGIENSPIFLRVVQVEAKKDSFRTGMLEVTIKLSTMFPKPAGGGR